MNNTPKVREYIPNYIDPKQIINATKLRVAAYARVSTDKEEQEESYERQVDYYTRYIGSKQEWEFAGIYSDPGITGTREDKRVGFRKMIADCKKGLIDKILCKSIARFARNTVDALKNIRELKELGISVYFETQNIDTLTPGGEVLLIVLTGIAEEESRTISHNVKWAMQKKFEKGDFMLNYNRFLGYTRDEEHKLVIVPEEAEIVKRIFREYLYGYGYAAIAKRLSDDGIITITGNKKWHPSVVQSILSNVKYCGDAIMGKTYKIDVLSKKRLKNDGTTSKMYYAENVIPPIIDKKTFDLVQMQMKQRAGIKGCSKTNDGKYSSKYALSKKIICGECGNYYRRHAQQTDGKYQATWVCANHKLHPNECKQMYITEEYVKKSFVKCLDDTIDDIEKTKQNIISRVAKVLDSSIETKIKVIDIAMEDLQKAMMKCYKERQSKEISEDEYKNRATSIATKINELKTEKEKLEQENGSIQLSKNRLEQIEKFINELNINHEFNEQMFNAIVDKIIVRNRYELEFQFKIGITKTVNYRQE